jgi:serine phosphatase RsbU (regulator of sigma subunit)
MKTDVFEGLEFGMEVQVAVAKVSKYATRESGDTLEMIERPHGGLSFVLVDGQRSGRGAKAISNLVARKAISLLADGVRDGAAARAAHDYLYTHKQGQVSATLNILSIDLVSKTIVLSRNSNCPVLIADRDGIRLWDEPCQPIGIYPMTKPVITQAPLVEGTYLVVFTDGVLTAGERYGEKLDLIGLVSNFLTRSDHHAQALVDEILSRTIALDRGRPGDDISVLVVAIVPSASNNGTRRLQLTFPISSP